MPLMSQAGELPVTVRLNCLAHWAMVTQPQDWGSETLLLGIAVLNTHRELHHLTSSVTPNLTTLVKSRHCVIIKDSYRSLILTIFKSR